MLWNHQDLKSAKMNESLLTTIRHFEFSHRTWIDDAALGQQIVALGIDIRDGRSDCSAV